MLLTDGIVDWVGGDALDTTDEGGPLILLLDEDGEIAHWIWTRYPPRYALRKLTQQAKWAPENLIRQPWLVTSYSDDIFARVRAVDRARCDALRLRHFPRLEEQVGSVEPEELSDPSSIRSEEQRAIAEDTRHRELAARAKTALRKVWKYDTLMKDLKKDSQKGKVVRGYKVEYARAATKRALAREEFSRPIEDILTELDPERFPRERFVAARRERLAEAAKRTKDSGGKEM